MKKIVSIILVAVMLCVVFVGCSKKNQQQETQAPQTNNNAGGVGLVVDPNQGDYQAPETAAPDPGIACPGWGEITIKPDTTDITVDFYNPIENANYYYLTFRLCLIENGQEVELYKSGLIEPGKHIQRITISRSFDVGEYDAIMHVQPYKMGSLTATNNMDSVVKLKVVAPV